MILYTISWAWLHENEPHALVGSLKDCEALWSLLHSAKLPVGFSRITVCSDGCPVQEYLADPSLLTTGGENDRFIDLCLNWSISQRTEDWRKG